MAQRIEDAIAALEKADVPGKPEKPEKPSVRKELREIQNARKKEAERRENRNDPVRNQGNKDWEQIRHQQPQQKRKPSRKGKER